MLGHRDFVKLIDSFATICRSILNIFRLTIAPRPFRAYVVKLCTFEFIAEHSFAVQGKML